MSDGIPFSELTEEQIKQVEYLFADEFFGTDVNAYLYELNQRGDVKGRCLAKPTEPLKTRAKRQAAVRITAIEDVNVTKETIDRAHTNLDVLAASIAKDIYQESIKNKGEKDDTGG